MFGVRNARSHGPKKVAGTTAGDPQYRSARTNLSARAWLVSIIRTFAVGVIAVVMALLVGSSPLSLDREPGGLIFGILVFAPLVESLVMSPILAELKKLVRNTQWVALVSAVIWGARHGLYNVVQGVVITWVFSSLRCHW